MIIVAYRSRLVAADELFLAENPVDRLNITAKDLDNVLLVELAHRIF